MILYFASNRNTSTRIILGCIMDVAMFFFSLVTTQVFPASSEVFFKLHFKHNICIVATLSVNLTVSFGMFLNDEAFDYKRRHIMP